ncbi:hypothetical protein BJ994_003057 [Arthrobacter pigmenti]|uniref:Uncharacterized protein n=1 Tax=Arthrobacter pigmenti TaxID=271432 RepID=A0A846S0L8_9MICC|nr:hypothetical protein [Arthrobacter pigmenti]NJC23981.1 hypothetical protein [Arthrobacter pigmenti]
MRVFIAVMKRRISGWWKAALRPGYSVGRFAFIGLAMTGFITWASWEVWRNTPEWMARAADFVPGVELEIGLTALIGYSAIAIGLQIKARSEDKKGRPEFSKQSMRDRKLIDGMFLGSTAMVIVCWLTVLGLLMTSPPRYGLILFVSALTYLSCLATVDALERIDAGGLPQYYQDVRKARRTLSYYRRIRTPSTVWPTLTRGSRAFYAVSNILLAGLPATAVNLSIYLIIDWSVAGLNLRVMLWVYGTAVILAGGTMAVYFYFATQVRSPDFTTRVGARLMALALSILLGLTVVTWIIGEGRSLGSYFVTVSSISPIIFTWLSLRWTKESLDRGNRLWLIRSDWWPGGLVRVLVSRHVHRATVDAQENLNKQKELQRDAELRAMGKIRRSIVRAAASLQLSGIERRLRYDFGNLD